MARIYPDLTEGQTVSWQGINRTHGGTVVRSDDRGALVRMQSGRCVLLSTEQSHNAAEAARNQKQLNTRKI